GSSHYFVGSDPLPYRGNSYPGFFANRQGWSEGARTVTTLGDSVLVAMPAFDAEFSRAFASSFEFSSEEEYGWDGFGHYAGASLTTESEGENTISAASGSVLGVSVSTGTSQNTIDNEDDQFQEGFSLTPRRASFLTGPSPEGVEGPTRYYINFTEASFFEIGR